jgi:hypothetical protein
VFVLGLHFFDDGHHDPGFTQPALSTWVCGLAWPTIACGWRTAPFRLQWSPNRDSAFFEHGLEFWIVRIDDPQLLLPGAGS